MNHFEGSVGVFFFFSRFFYVDHFKVFIEFATILLLFYVFFGYKPCGNLSSLTRDRTCTP